MWQEVLTGRYYLYYSKDDTSVIGVAVCDSPAGKYEFLGEVHYRDGRVVGDGESEYFMFDPSVLIDGDRIWLYSVHRYAARLPESNAIWRAAP